MTEEKKIRIYKRPEASVNDGHAFDSTGMLKSRPWTVIETLNGYPMKTCYETWEDALEWALTPAMFRGWIINYEMWEGGW